MHLKATAIRNLPGRSCRLDEPDRDRAPGPCVHRPRPPGARSHEPPRRSWPPPAFGTPAPVPDNTQPSMAPAASPRVHRGDRIVPCPGLRPDSYHGMESAANGALDGTAGLPFRSAGGGGEGGSNPDLSGRCLSSSARPHMVELSGRARAAAGPPPMAATAPARLAHQGRGGRGSGFLRSSRLTRLRVGALGRSNEQFQARSDCVRRSCTAPRAGQGR
jgi:hypothetical protein